MNGEAMHSITAAYRQLQTQDPVHWSANGHWVVSRYEDVKAVLGDPRFGHVMPTPPPSPGGGWWSRWLQPHGLGMPHLAASSDPVSSVTVLWLAHQNPPTHTRLRRAVNEALSPARIQATRSRTAAIADELIDHARARGGMDIVADFAYPLVTRQITELLGVPAGDFEQVEPWMFHSQRIFFQAEPPQDVRRDHKLARDMLRYFHALITERRRQPRQDLISALATGDPAHALSDDELLSNTILLATAGHQSAYDFLGAAVYELLQQRAHPPTAGEGAELSRTAVHELLRYSGPVQFTARHALEDVTLGGRHIRRGQVVHLALAAANRDPEKFPDPDRLDLTRQPNAHLAFGYGIHQCAGSALALQQAAVALGTLFHRLPDLRLEAAGLQWRDDIYHAPKALRVTF